ncbi:superoxide dismutase family protein [Streptomyces sp. NPDC008150]|uniref:superoxide dismutase family protein n=1 Tax=Streptomyces sp. NPDC008150 TaxID=3364816 RepID=UPI0036E99019
MLAGTCVGAVVAATVVLASGTGVAAGGPTADAHGWRPATARFAAPAAGVVPRAVTYDADLVPVGSSIRVDRRNGADGSTDVRLRVTGLRPGHAYGVHVHQKPCGNDPAAAGGHFQHEPSADPAAANPGNEVWLDLTTGRGGSGSARAHHAWGFAPGAASSVVIHDMPGTKGSRVACFTVPFGGRSGGTPAGS